MNMQEHVKNVREAERLINNAKCNLQTIRDELTRHIDYLIDAEYEAIKDRLALDEALTPPDDLRKLAEDYASRWT